jgi:hypothetical protein
MAKSSTPTRDEILWVSTIDDNPPTSRELMGAARIIGSSCLNENVQFYACKSEHKNPEKCLQEGYQVSLCVQQV